MSREIERDADVERLVLYRTKRGLSQEKIARMLGVSWATVNRWERSKNAPSDMARLIIRTFLEQKEVPF